jgi:hypothetical protein
MAKPLRVVLVKPSKYAADGFVERFRWGFMPNSTLPHLESLTPRRIDGQAIQVTAVDEYVETDLGYLSLLRRDRDRRTLLALVGVQSHQFQRALDLAAYALAEGVENCVIGGPHSMTCDTSALQGRGVSFALGEAELLWESILADGLDGDLRAVYGGESRWQRDLTAPVVEPPPRARLRRYVVPILGVYPARGCPFACSFCSVIKIAGRQVRSQPVETTLATLRRAKSAGVRLVLFTSDNFNKYADAVPLLEAMVADRIELPFFVQCDAQIAAQADLVELLARAGCFQIFVGAESFSRTALLAVNKGHNHPERYGDIVRLCRSHGITSHFSNILGFPTDTELEILDHLRALRELDPDVASFYILTPIPGTQQYDEFLAAGLITETDLDRFDGTCAVWRHPHLAAERLTQLLFRCYREFYRWGAMSGKTLNHLRHRDFRTGATAFAVLGQTALARHAAFRGAHPMAGGVGRVRRDKLRDYLGLRRARYGLDRAPLPASLALSAADLELSRRPHRPVTSASNLQPPHRALTTGPHHRSFASSKSGSTEVKRWPS